MTDSTDTILDAAKVAGAIVEYQRTEAALAELRKRFEGVIFDVTTPEGDRSARAARKELVSLRTSLETKRVTLKAPALEYSRRIDSEAKRITGEIVALEGPIDAQVRAHEERQALERKRRADEEAARLLTLQEAVAAIRRIPPDAATASSAAIDQHIKLLTELAIDAKFEEFEDQAHAARREAMAMLTALRQGAVAREAEVARMAAERIELERLRAEQTERERVERARVAAEQARITAEQLAENERQAAARVDIEARERALRDEQARVETHAATLRAQELAAEQAARAERELREREARALAAEQQRRALDAAEQAADRVREAAPVLLAACKSLLALHERLRGPDEQPPYYEVTEARAAVAAAEEPTPLTTPKEKAR